MTFISKKLTYSTISILSLFALLYALYLQHVEGHQPCILCVQIRLAFLLTFISSLIALAKHKGLVTSSNILLWMSILSGGASSYELYQLQNTPNPFATCSFTPSFWLPLDQWLPFVFKVQANCTDEITTIFNISMAAWSVIAFTIFAILMLVLYWELLKRK